MIADAKKKGTSMNYALDLWKSRGRITDADFALESAKQNYIYEAKTKADFLSRSNWMYSLAKACLLYTSDAADE